jgi:hypothetical protein
LLSTSTAAIPRNRDRDRHHELDYDRDRDRDLANALDHARDLLHDFARKLAHELVRDLNVAFSLARDLAHDLKRTHDRTRLLARDGDPDLARIHSRDRDLDHRRASDLALALEFARDRVLADRGNFVGDMAGLLQVRSSRAATRVLHSAVRVLPLGARDRYREEFERELLDLAANGVSRRGQLAHAAKVAGRAWTLRRATRRSSLAKDTG